MNRIDKAFENIKKEKRCGLIPYFTAGYPSLKASQKLIEKTVKEGIADIIEIGLPFRCTATL